MDRFRATLLRASPAWLSALLAFVPFHPQAGFLWPLLFFALVPWLRSLSDLGGRADARAGWRSGYSFGLLFAGLQLFWLFQFVYRWTESWPLAIVPYLAALSLMSVYFGLFGVIAVRLYARGWAWLIPFAWGGIEVFRSYIPVLAFPWGLISTPLSAAPAVIGFAEWGTQYLVSSFVVAINVALATLGRPESVRTVPILGGFVALCMVGSVATALPEERENWPVTALQPGVDLAFGDPRTEAQRLARAINPWIDEIDESGAALLVMPEGLGRVEGETPAPVFRLPLRVATLFGGQRVAERTYQTAFVAERGQYRYADKTRLVIFGEFVPFREFLPAGFRLPAGDLSPSDSGLKSLGIERGTVGPVLCFEALFPDISLRHAESGVQMIAVMSVDDWFLQTWAVPQLRAATIWRAVETGRPIARAGGLGPTMLVNPNGIVLQEATLGKSLAISADLAVTPPRVKKWPLWWGVWGLLGLAALVGLVPVRARKQDSGLVGRD